MSKLLIYSMTPPFAPMSWRGGFHPPVLLCCAVILAVNWLIPENWINNSATAMAFAQWVRQKLLLISPHADIWAHARTTLFPNAALFNHALLWTFILAIAIYNIGVVVLNAKVWVGHFEKNMWPSFDKKTRLAMLAAGIFAIAGLWTLTMMPGKMEYTASADLRSRIFLGFITSCAFLFAHLAAFGQTIMFLSFINKFFKKEPS